MIRVGSPDFYPVVKGIMGFMEAQDVAKRRRLVRASRVSGMKNSAFQLDDVLSSKSLDWLKVCRVYSGPSLKLTATSPLKIWMVGRRSYSFLEILGVNC